jgi:hypothetical protein
MSLTRAVASGSARNALRALPAASSSSARTLTTSARRLEEKKPAKKEKRKSNRIYDKGTFNFNTSLNFVADRDPDVSVVGAAGRALWSSLVVCRSNGSRATTGP